jgi:hypothetical protein
MRKLRVAVAVAVASAGGLVATGGVLAQASDPGTAASPAVVAPPTADLPSSKSQRATSRAARCFGQMDNPHNSRHFPGHVSVSSRTVCPGHAVAVTVRLYKRVRGSWRFLDSGSNRGVGRTQANAHGACGRRGTSHRFLGVGYHTATRHHPAITRNAQTVTCR